MSINRNDIVLIIYFESKYLDKFNYVRLKNGEWWSINDERISDEHQIINFKIETEVCEVEEEYRKQVLLNKLND